MSASSKPFQLDSDSTIHYRISNNRPQISRAEIVMEKENEKVLHLPANPVVEAIRVDEVKMSGMALTREDRAYTELELYGVRKWRDAFEVQVLLPDSCGQNDSFVHCNGGVNKSLGLADEDAISLSIGGTELRLSYKDNWVLSSVDSGELDVYVSPVENFLGLDNMALVVGFEERFDEVSMK